MKLYEAELYNDSDCLISDDGRGQRTVFLKIDDERLQEGDKIIIKKVV